jgi:hypothetical protein
MALAGIFTSGIPFYGITVWDEATYYTFTIYFSFELHRVQYASLQCSKMQGV